MNKYIRKNIIGLFFIFGITCIPMSVIASAPSINVYQQSNSVKAEWAMEIPTSDILTSTSFEYGQETPDFRAGGNAQIGNQSIVEGIFHTGFRSIQLYNTRNMTGNAWWFPNTQSDSSIFALSPKRIPNGTNLSITFKARAIGGDYSYINFSNNSPHSNQGITFNDYSGREVKFAQTVNFQYTPSEFSVYIDNGTPNFPDNLLVTLVSSHGKNHNYGIIYYRWSVAKQKFVIDASNTRPFQSGNLFGKQYTLQNDIFQAGEPVLHLEWVGIHFDGRYIPNTGEWVTISSNVFMNHPRYDFYENGFGSRLNWSTNGTMQVDDVTFGYATKAELYRNNTKVYEGYLSDFQDSGATDRANPHPIVPTLIQNGQNVVWKFARPQDLGTEYEYYVNAISKSNIVTPSKKQIVNVTSGIKGYSYVIDKNPSTIPDDTVDTTSEIIQTTMPNNEKYYLHVKAIDNAGNSSIVQHDASYDHEPPTVGQVTIENLTEDGYDVVVKGVSDTGTGIDRVQFPTWTDKDGQDDLDNTWETNPKSTGIHEGNGTWRYHVSRANHFNEYGLYNTHIYAYDKAGNKTAYVTSTYLDNVLPNGTYTLSPSTLTKNSVTIEFKASDNFSVKGIQLPDGNVVNTTSVNYRVYANGDYRFVIEDSAGNKNTVVALVSNIYEDFILEAKANKDSNKIELNWNNPFGVPATYVLYRKNDKGEWESIPAKATVKVLNIYPDSYVPNTGLAGGQIDLDGNIVSDSGILKTWLLKENIQDVQIETVSLSSFNANPSHYLAKANSGWNYDAVFYGMWNLDPYLVYPNDTAIEYLRTFIKDGGGFMTSHHTMGYRGLDKGVNKLADEMGVEIFSNQTNEKCPAYGGRDANGVMYPSVSFEVLENITCDYSSYWSMGDTIEIAKKGLLTEYPFKVGEVGQQYTIPLQHGLNIFGKGEVWMKTANPSGYYFIPFKEITVSPRTGAVGTNNFFMHTYNNTAIINSGHSFPAISESEVRIIANTLYYLAQTTIETSWEDRVGMDNVAPDKPNISLLKQINGQLTYEVSSKDNGIESEYMVKARNSLHEITSNVAKTSLIQGIDGYSYEIDNNPTTIPDEVVDTKITKIPMTVSSNQKTYLHVRAIDKGGNASDTAHISYQDTNAPSLELLSDTVDWTNTEIIITANADDNETGLKYIQLPNGDINPNAKTVTYRIQANGTYTFVAEDNAGNRTTKSIVITQFDIKAPSPPIINSVDGWTKDIPIEVSIIPGKDSESGVLRTEYKLEGATNKPWSNYVGDFSLSEEGITQIIARSVDKVGNVSTETVKVVKIDLTKPLNTSITIKLKH